MPEHSFGAGHAARSAFEQQPGEQLPLANRIWALRLQGRLALVRAGASGPQLEP